MQARRTSKNKGPVSLGKFIALVTRKHETRIIIDKADMFDGIEFDNILSPWKCNWSVHLRVAKPFIAFLLLTYTHYWISA